MGCAWLVVGLVGGQGLLGAVMGAGAVGNGQGDKSRKAHGKEAIPALIRT